MSLVHSTFTAELRTQAQGLGFDAVGVCPAVIWPGWGKFQDWLAAGYAGEMHYLEGRLPAYEHPSGVLDGARSLVMLAHSYRNEEPQPAKAGQGRVARYAWGVDYHEVIRAKLHQLADYARQQLPTAGVRGVVDSAPLAEREFAQLAGLGWIGKNTLLLNKKLGSWFFLSALLLDVELEYDAAHVAQHCGTCRACLDACPTQAFVAPYVLDASKCISYLTIEHRTPIPHSLRPGMEDWVYGCDVCQDVCPWNHKAAPSAEPAYHPSAGLNPLPLPELFFLDEPAFRTNFRHSPLWRPKRRGLLRNAAIVLGNQRDASSLPALCHGLHDPEPLVRGACAWALGQFSIQQSEAALAQRQVVEEDAIVIEEIRLALSSLSR